MEVQDVIEEVKGISLKDGSTRFWKQKGCQYGYRQSIFKSELWGQYAITYVTFRLKKHFEPKLQYGGLVKAVEEKGLTKDTLTAQELRQIIIDIRRAKLPDPKEQGNAGSFFKNPVVSREQAERNAGDGILAPQLALEDALPVAVLAVFLLPETC